MAEIGRTAPPRSTRAAEYEPGRMVFVGGPEQVAERILHLHSMPGRSRQILQMEVGGMPHCTVLRGIELLGTEVLPRIRKELAGSSTWTAVPARRVPRWRGPRLYGKGRPDRIEDPRLDRTPEWIGGPV